MENVLFKSGLCVTMRNLALQNHLNEKSFKRRLEALLSDYGLCITWATATTLEDNWKITDAGGGSIQIKAGIAIFSDYEVVELASDSDAIAVTDDSATYTVLITRSDSEYETGTIAVTTGSLNLVGTGTLFTEEFEVGERIKLDASIAGNQVDLIIASITSNLAMTVEAIDGDGDPVSLTNESSLDFWSIGRFANGYPAAGDDKNIRNHDAVSIVVTTSPGTYTNKITLGTVSNTGGVLTIVDQRDANLAEVRNANWDAFSTILEKVLGGSPAYLVKKVQITGTSGSPQTISYSSLTNAHTGAALPASFTTPCVTIVGLYQDRGVFKTEDEGTATFKVAMSSYGTGSTVYADFVICECG